MSLTKRIMLKMFTQQLLCHQSFRMCKIQHTNYFQYYIKYDKLMFEKLLIIRQLIEITKSTEESKTSPASSFDNFPVNPSILTINTPDMLLMMS